MKNNRTIMIGGALGLLVLAVLAYMVVLSPRLAEAASIAEATDVVVANNDTLRLEQERLTADLNNAETAIADARAIQVQFPGTAELPVLFDSIEAEAKKAGIPADNVTTVTPSNPELVTAQGGAGAAAAGAQAGGGAATMAVDITATGDYGKLVAFLTNLQNLQRVYLIDTATFSSDDENGYTLSITGRMILVDQAPMNDYIAQVEELAGLPASAPMNIVVENVPDPVSSATAAPVEGETPAPAASGEPAPAEGETPAPAASGEPAPADPAPAASPSPSPAG